MANVITAIRIVCAAALLFFQPLSPGFYVLYVIAGLTDMIDGTVARMTGTASEFGAKLDTVADFALVTVCLIKLIPVLELPVWLWLWIGGIALIKMLNIVSGCVMSKKLVTAHTVMNKVTGFLLFALPLTLPTIDLRISGSLVCAVATFAAIQEGHYIRTGRDDGYVCPKDCKPAVGTPLTGTRAPSAKALGPIAHEMASADSINAVPTDTNETAAKQIL